MESQRGSIGSSCALLERISLRVCCDQLFQTCVKLSKSKDIFKREKVGKRGHKTLNRRSAAFGDPGAKYNYSGASHSALPWPEWLLPIKKRLEDLAEHTFELALITEFQGGSKLGLHQDNEAEIAPESMIPAISLGDGRKVQFANLNKKVLKEILVEHGSLYVMEKDSQKIIYHGIPEKTHGKLRFSITFRHLDLELPPSVLGKRKTKPTHTSRSTDKKGKNVLRESAGLSESGPAQ